MNALPGLAGSPAAANTIAVVQQPPKPDDPGGRGEDFGKSSPVGLLVLILFLVAVAFLARSMTRHLKRVPASFDAPEPGAEAPDGSDGPGKPAKADGDDDPAGGPADDAAPSGKAEKAEEKQG